MKTKERAPKAEREKRTVSPTLPALDRAKAVLSVWSERRKPSQVCRSLGIKWTVLKNWEERALSGMLQALQPRKEAEPAPALSRRLQVLIERKEDQGEARVSRLEKRLLRLQKSKSLPDEAPSLKGPEAKEG